MPLFPLGRFAKQQGETGVQGGGRDGLTHNKRKGAKCLFLVSAGVAAHEGKRGGAEISSWPAVLLLHVLFAGAGWVGWF